MPPAAARNLFVKRFLAFRKRFNRETFSLFSSCTSWFTKTDGGFGVQEIKHCLQIKD